LQNLQQDIISTSNTDSMPSRQYNQGQPYYTNQNNSYPQNQQNFPILPENNNIPSQNFGQGAKTSFSNYF